MNEFEVKKLGVIAYCSGCGFKLCPDDFNKRIDGKYFCGTCVLSSSIRLKRPNKDFCSLCGFKAYVDRQGELAKNKDGHYYHVPCWHRKDVHGDIVALQEEYNKNRKYNIFLGLLLLLVLVCGLCFIWKGGKNS